MLSPRGNPNMPALQLTPFTFCAAKLHSSPLMPNGIGFPLSACVSRVNQNLANQPGGLAYLRRTGSPSGPSFRRASPPGEGESLVRPKAPSNRPTRFGLRNAAHKRPKLRRIRPPSSVGCIGNGDLKARSSRLGFTK
jgi:hypothetical protein